MMIMPFIALYQIEITGKLSVIFFFYSSIEHFFYNSSFTAFRLHSRRTGLGFIRCKGLLSRLILRLEVHFLQILPFCERVIGRKSRRMKLYRQL